MTEHWLERWREGKIGWHEASGNASLKKHWRASGCSVLVPLCGKSIDLCWLAAQGNRVVGVELSPLAVEAFFAEQRLGYSIADDELPRYDANDVEISIYCGDFFALRSLSCDAHYDRGALVAMQPDARPAYAAQVSSLLTDSAEQLVITLEYDDNIAAGPPFSIGDDEVLGHWPRLERVDTYDDIANAPPKFIEAGLERIAEKVWRTP